MMNNNKTDCEGYYRCRARLCQVVTYGPLCHRCGYEADYREHSACAYCFQKDTHLSDCPCFVQEFKPGDLVTSNLFDGLAEIQSIENGVADCVLTQGDSYMVRLESLTLYSDYQSSEYFDRNVSTDATGAISI